MNYFEFTENVIKEVLSGTKKPKLLLQSCCAPCSTKALEYLKGAFDLTVLYYNPNIYPEEEYVKRKNEQIRYLNQIGVKFLDCDYNHLEFLQAVIGLEQEKEGGRRCEKCFSLRLKKTFELAKENGFDYFSTTLTVSPHKNSKTINEIGLLMQTEEVKYLPCDLKKKNGYLRSIEIAKEYGLYRQNYCGCEFAYNTNK